VLFRLVEDVDFHVRGKATQHPRGDVAVRRAALHTGDRDCRWALAQLPDLPWELTQALLADDDRAVREQLAQATAHEAAIAALLGDPHPAVRGAVASNDNATEANLRQLAHDRHAQARIGAAVCPRTPPDVLMRLTSDRSAEVPFWLTTQLEHRDVLKALTEDMDRHEASTARNSLRNPPDPERARTELAEAVELLRSTGHDVPDLQSLPSFGYGLAIRIFWGRKSTVTAWVSTLMIRPMP
jgi:hypothetical protein